MTEMPWNEIAGAVIFLIGVHFFARFWNWLESRQ